MQVDARDLFSPKPQIMALEAIQQLKKHETLAVLVNDGKAVDELMHLAEEYHCGFTLENEDEYSVVTLAPTSKIKVANPLEEALRMMGIRPNLAPVYLFGADSIGRGNDELGRILLREIIFDLSLQEELPGALVFYNSGAKLTQKDSHALESLQQLAALGVEILTDTVSLEAFGSEEELAVGDAVDPYLIVALLSGYPGVITM